MVFTDPPYGINVVSQGSFGDGKRHGKMAAHHNKYNDIINDDSIKTAQDSYNLCKSLQIEILIFWGANFYPSILEDGMSWLVWDKETCAPSFSDCEIAFVNKKGKLKIFKHQWSGMIRNSERGEKRTHPSQKPIALSEWCFDEYGKDAKSVLDLFGGSGSTLIASEKTNRKCFMMELSPSYVSVIIIRWMKFTGKMAYLLNDDGSQTSWDELNEERRKTS
jgi:site-specific DNA-methyltransferase (adenine-specific)